MASSSWQPDKPYRLYPSVRLCMFLLVLVATSFLGGGFVAFNFSIVCMVNESAIISPYSNGQFSNIPNSSVNGCEGSASVDTDEEEREEGYDGEFVWDKVTQSNLLAAHSYGAVLSSLCCGLIADRYGSKPVILAGLTVNAIANAVTPVAAYTGVAWVFMARVLQGLGAGVAWPASVAMAPTWGTPSETGTLLTLAAIGPHVGYLVAMASSSEICTSRFRWPLAFYMWAGLSLLFILVWMALYTDDPTKCRFISKAELNFLMKYKMRKTQNRQSLHRIPWKRILLSPCIIAIYFCQIGSSWATYYVSIFMPTYSKEVLHLPVHSNGFNSGLSSLSHCLGRLIFAPLGDKISFCGRPKIVNIKVFNAVCTILPCLCFLLLGFLDCHQTELSVASFCLATFFLASSTGGYARAGVLIAPRYAGLISSLYITCGYGAAIIMPYAVGGMAKHGTTEEWKHTAFLTASVLAASFFQFQLLGSAEEEEWAKEDGTENGRVFNIDKNTP